MLKLAIVIVLLSCSIGVVLSCKGAKGANGVGNGAAGLPGAGGGPGCDGGTAMFPKLKICNMNQLIL